MLSSNFLLATDYNSVPGIEGQGPLSQDILYELGQIFVSHGVNEEVGIDILHKHFMLDDDTIMVHNGLRCAPDSVENFETDMPMTGSSFFLSYNGIFQASEYEQGEPLHLSDGFLQELRFYILEHNIGRQIALSRLGPDYPRKLMEHCEPSSRSHVCVDASDYEIPLAWVTGWKFRLGNGIARPFIVRGCARRWSLNHRRK